VRDRLSFVFEDLGEQQVKNVRRPVRVYRVRTTLTHPVPTDQVRGLKAHDAPGSPLSRIAGEGAERRGREAGEGNTLSLPDKPSIAVLPFANMSGDPEQEYFVDGMVEEIVTALSRIRWLFVIARNSSFTYKGRYDLQNGWNYLTHDPRLSDGRLHVWRSIADGSMEKDGKFVIGVP